MRGRERLVLSPASSAVFVAAAVAVLTGRTTLALVGIVVGFALLLLGQVLGRRHQSAPVPALRPDEVAATREVRDRDGEVAAVKHLRDGHPELALADAVRLVRAL